MPERVKILLVDDDALDRMAARRALRASGLDGDLEEASDAAGASAALRGDGFDLAILDYELPDGNGLDVLREARAAGNRTPIVMLTGHGDEMIAVELMKAGASDYLPKTALTSERLGQSVRAVLRVREAERQAQRAEEALSQTSRTLQTLVQASPLAIVALDSERRVQVWNAAAERMFGWQAEEVLGRPYPIVPVGDEARYEENWAWVIHGGSIAEFESGRRRKDGSVVQVSASIAPQRDAAGRIQGAIVVLSDVTERRRAQDQLRRSEERYRSLVEATAQIVWTASASGEFAAPQPQWSGFTGQTFDETRGWGWLTAVHPGDQWHTAEAWAAAVRDRTPYEVEQRLRRRDGVYRYFNARAVPIEEDGRVREWVGVHTDITGRRQAEDRLRLLAEASKVLGESLDYEAALRGVARLAVRDIADGCVVDLVGEDGRLRRVAIEHADPAAGRRAWEADARHPVSAEASGPAEVIRSGRAQLLPEVTDSLLASAAADAEHLSLLQSLEIRSYLCAPMQARGRQVGALTLLTTAVSERRYGAADLDLAEELARRAALAVDNARLFRETRARAEREALINRIGQTLRGSLDMNEILRRATRAVGEALGVSRCVWARLDAARGVIEAMPAQYAAPGVPPVAPLVSLADYPPEMVSQWSAGCPVAVPHFGEGPAEVGTRALLACPVLLRGEWTGVLAVHQTDRPRLWTQDEVDLLCAVADMLVLALENARLYAREHRVADMLQAAFLPDIPDRLPGLTLGKQYHTGLAEAHVGGDFYDAFTLPDGRVALVMADVSGKGLSAAVQTATVKYSLRAFAAEVAAPSLVLRRLNRTLRSDTAGLGDHFVTLFYAVFDPKTRTLAYASAGHETQLLRTAGGEIAALEANGPILGLAEHAYVQQARRLEPGDTLFLFTDGLTEARAPVTRALLDVAGVSGLIRSAPPEAAPPALALLLAEAALRWTDGQRQDDIALLVARVEAGDENDPAAVSAVQAATGEGQGVDSAPGEEALFTFAFPGRAEFAAEVRQAVAHWMSVLGFERAEIEDMQTAATEAVTNAVRHGSPRGEDNQFFVWGSLTPEAALAVEVADEGPGLPDARRAPPMPGPEATGGRGLPLMQLLADSVTFPPSEAGHRVRLVKRRAAPG